MKKFKLSKKTIILTVCCLLVVVLTAVLCAYTATRQMTPVIDEEDYVLDDEGNPIRTTSADRKQDFFTFLIVGTDGGVNTDTIMVAAVDTADKKINILSIPRDTMSNVPRTVKKINAAFSVDGIPQVKKELKNLIGFDIDRYLLIDLKGFERIIDAVGGVDMYVPSDMDYEDPAQDLYIHLKQGQQVLNGKHALEFVRFRSGYADADLGRIKAQQSFLQALADTLMQPSTLLKAGELSKIVAETVTTDMDLGEFIWLAKMGSGFNTTSGISMDTLPGTPRYCFGLSYVVPDEEKILELVNEKFNPYKKPLVKLNLFPIDSIVETGPVIDRPDLPESDVPTAPVYQEPEGTPPPAEPTQTPLPDVSPSQTPAATVSPSPTPESTPVVDSTPDMTPAAEETPVSSPTPQAGTVVGEGENEDGLL